MRRFWRNIENDPVKFLFLALLAQCMMFLASLIALVVLAQ